MFSASLRTGITTESCTEARGENCDYPIPTRRRFSAFAPATCERGRKADKVILGFGGNVENYFGKGGGMRFETWQKQFQPVHNHLTKNTAIEGHVFLPNGVDLDFVRSQSRDKVWSFIVCDEGRSPAWLISEGYHFVNVMGYLVTQNSFDTAKTYTVRY